MPTGLLIICASWCRVAPLWASSELTLAQLLALHFISAKAPMSLMSLVSLMSLSHALDLRPPATWAMVDRLARAGLVCRRPDPADRRRVLLTVTAHAVAMLGKVDPQTARRLQRVVAYMGAAAQRCLIELVKDTARRLAS